jgi:hypothetical protein
MTDAALRQGLEEAARFDAEYGASLSNHLPMALVALARLGADGARLQAFSAHYARRLHAAPPPEPWPAGDPWTGRLGDPRAWPAYRSLFREWVAYEGAATVLAQALPRLMQGAGAAAFHGLIRSAYALAANHAEALADALAYWACRWFSCGRPPTGGTQDDPARVLASLPRPSVSGADLIAQAMARAAADPGFAPALAAWRFGDDTLARLARAAAERYADHDGFTTLHLVTSAHALTVLLPWFDDASDRREAVAHYALAYAAAWATLGTERSAPAAPPLAWDTIVARALASDDDHVIKLVDSARELERVHGGAVWQRAAARAVAQGA